MNDSHDVTSSSPKPSSSAGATIASERDLDDEQRQAYERELLYGESVEHVRALMEHIGLSQRELARRLGVTDARVSRMLSGRENLTLRTVAELGWATGVRFTIVPEPMDREGTPAVNDPPTPRWLETYAAMVARRVRGALRGKT